MASNEWHDGTEGLAAYLAQDSKRRADVVIEARYEDEREDEAEAYWSAAAMAVQFTSEEWPGPISYSYLTRDIIRWRPKREPFTLRGSVTSDRATKRVTILLPDEMPAGTAFTFTLEEIIK